MSEALRSSPPAPGAVRAKVVASSLHSNCRFVSESELFVILDSVQTVNSSGAGGYSMGCGPSVSLTTLALTSDSGPPTRKAWVRFGVYAPSQGPCNIFVPSQICQRSFRSPASPSALGTQAMMLPGGNSKCMIKMYFNKLTEENNILINRLSAVAYLCPLDR